MNLSKDMNHLVMNCSLIQPYYFKKDGREYKSYIVEIQADCFYSYSHSIQDLCASVEKYSKQLYERILFISKGEENLCLMSQQHIQEETLSHLLPWFLYARKLGKGVTWYACKEVNLNVDERRAPVVVLMWVSRLLYKAQKKS